MRFLRFVILALLLASIAFGPPTNNTRAAEPTTTKLGSTIGNFTLKDANGKPFSLHDLKDKKAVVLVFLSFECPVSNSYAGPLTELGKKYTDKGVTVVGICAVDEDEVVAAAKQVQEFKVGFPVYYDTKRVSVDALKAEVTPEAFVLDHNFVLRYRGRIDNGWTTRL